MLALIRLGAYVMSGLVLWQFIHDGPGLANILPVNKKLALDPEHAMVFGVCAGISNYTGIDPALIRMAWAAACLFRGVGVVLYILAFLIMPASAPHYP